MSTVETLYDAIYVRWLAEEQPARPTPTPRQVREAAGARANCPIEYTDGDRAPELVGESWHYETKTGRRIHYPSAYSKRGWSSMVYCPSTLRVEVGRDWRA